jgi:hypothetical protein
MPLLSSPLPLRLSPSLPPLSIKTSDLRIYISCLELTWNSLEHFRINSHTELERLSPFGLLILLHPLPLQNLHSLQWVKAFKLNLSCWSQKISNHYTRCV